MRKYKNIIVDMDGVMVDLLTPTLEYMNEQLGVAIADNEVKTFSVEKPYIDAGLDPLDVSRALNELWCRAGFWYELEPRYGCITTLKELCEDFGILIATRIYNVAATCGNEKYWWCKKRFNPEMKERKIQFFCVGSAKKSMLRGDLLIDDGPMELEDALENGIDALRFDLPVNRDHDFGIDVPFVSNWKEVKEFVYGER